MEKKYKEVVITIALFVIYGIYACWRCSHIAIDSDYSNLVLEAQDMLQGNVLRSGWSLTGLSFFPTDLLYFCAGVALFGVSLKAYYFACGFMITMLVFVSWLLVKDYIAEDKITKLLLFVAAVMLPCRFAVYTLRAHTGVFVWMFLALYLYEHYIRNKSRRHVVGYILCVVLAVMGDPIGLLLVPLPLCIWSIILWLQEKQTLKESCAILFQNIIAIVIAFVLDKLYFLIGGANKNSFLERQTFINLDEIWSKLALYIRTLLYLGDGNIEAVPIVSAASVLAIANICFILLAFIFIIWQIVNFIKQEKHDFTTVILGIGFLIISLLFILTTIGSNDIYCCRYYGFWPMLMGVVLVRNLSVFAQKRKRIVFLIALLSLFIVAGKIRSNTVEDKTESAVNMELIQVLEENNLTTGYASFWNASAITVISNDEIKSRAIVCFEEQMVPYDWYSKKDWYNEEAFFVITSEEDSTFGVQPNNVRKTFGLEDEIITVGDMEILVYNNGISY